MDRTRWHSLDHHCRARAQGLSRLRLPSENGRTGRVRYCAPFFLCAEHVRSLGGVSPLSILMEEKDKRFARASPRGGV